MFFIGIDPHKASYTAAVLDCHKQLVSEVRVRADHSQRDRLLAFADGFEPRCWAIEGTTGGALLALQLVAAGETVLDMPPASRCHATEEGTAIPRSRPGRRARRCMRAVRDARTGPRVHRAALGEAAALRVRRVDTMRGRLEVVEAMTEVNGKAVFGTTKTHQRSGDARARLGDVDARSVRAPVRRRARRRSGADRRGGSRARGCQVPRRRAFRGLTAARRSSRSTLVAPDLQVCWRPRQDSNLRTRFRKPMLYPLSYGG